MNNNVCHIIPRADVNVKYIKKLYLLLVGTSICSKSSKIYGRITHQIHDGRCLQERQGNEVLKGSKRSLHLILKIYLSFKIRSKHDTMLPIFI